MTFQSIIITILLRLASPFFLMPLEYWTYAFIAAVYLINGLPTPTLQNTSPFQTLFGTPPNYSKLRSFGCLCYPWLKPYTKHKLQPKSSPCIFVGYSPTQSAYYYLDPTTHKICTSLHVKFVEDVFPYTKLTLSPTASTPSSWASFTLPLHSSLLHDPIATDLTSLSSSSLPRSASPPPTATSTPSASSMPSSSPSSPLPRNASQTLPSPNPIPLRLIN